MEPSRSGVEANGQGKRTSYAAKPEVMISCLFSVIFVIQVVREYSSKPVYLKDLGTSFK
jgi:hypothetical protein